MGEGGSDARKMWGFCSLFCKSEGREFDKVLLIFVVLVNSQSLTNFTLPQGGDSKQNTTLNAPLPV